MTMLHEANGDEGDGRRSPELVADLRYKVQRFLLGEAAADVFRALRLEREERDSSMQQEDVATDEGSWMVMSSTWPTDGSWRSTPGVVSLISAPRFAESFPALRRSLSEQPFARNAAMEKGTGGDSEGVEDED